jgi:NADH:ubiquinone oxidoreductase subunit 5 (subunit L)/multisubunit Na+/H+ antiporter MnhA subunit
MPVTAITFLVGVFAIAGVGIPMAHIGLGGYFSKDEILAVAWHRVYGAGHGEGHALSSEPGAEATGHTTENALGGPTSGRSAQMVLVSDVQPEMGHRETDQRSVPQESTDQRSVPQRSVPQRLPPWLFWIPIIIAYVTAFYMMRAWWLTFMGQPRDQHVYDHAHESKLMYIPLVVLAVGTFFSSYYLFRPLVAEAAPLAFLTAAYDGAAATAAEAHGTLIDHSAHKVLALAVGFAFVVGFAIAILIYRRGLAVGERIARALRPLHTVLIHKFYFDEVYGLVLVGGTMALKEICYLFDKYVVDGLVNLSAFVTERVSAFSGIVLDQGVVDGVVNGVGRTTWGLGGLARAPQVGRIRNYILFAAGGVAAVVVWMAFA